MISASSTNQQRNPKRHFQLSHFWVTTLSDQPYNQHKKKAIKIIFLSWKNTLSSAMAKGREKRGRI